ncbi:pyridoxal phosphate phosphatase PHOSPHO2-like isoform X2 [Dreissena polymorpha]|uniref:pyridoxal phosphate phosphatase PHOSPHO2-like isoform X2 n=1 Tax=Dreissena polymorpha TaxID=45954 RepID=UPI002263BA73|nr:pyridoxal phosphate phosphatase PHOSPHO2-like isoform X2 [Dreissena polymorpha]
MQKITPMSTSSEKILVAFDFDHTLVDENSDIEIIKLCPGGKVPADLKHQWKKTGWIPYMGAIFEYLHENSVTESDMKNIIANIPFTPGMSDLLEYLRNSCFEVIIISDSNSVFINTALEQKGFKDVVDKVYTNPAHYDENGLLKIAFYHFQDWCDLSTENMCKGHILEEHIRQSDSKYRYVLYVGDGINDFCPALKLKETDYVFPRENYSLWEALIKPDEGEGSDKGQPAVQAQIVNWSSGLEIREVCKKLCEEKFHESCNL